MSNIVLDILKAIKTAIKFEGEPFGYFPISVDEDSNGITIWFKFNDSYGNLYRAFLDFNKIYNSEGYNVDENGNKIGEKIEIIKENITTVGFGIYDSKIDKFSDELTRINREFYRILNTVITIAKKGISEYLPQTKIIKISGTLKDKKRPPVYGHIAQDFSETYGKKAPDRNIITIQGKECMVYFIEIK